MTNFTKISTRPGVISEDEKLHEIARRALAPPDFPFNGLHIEAALLLNELSPAADTSFAGHSDAPNHCRPAHIQDITKQNLKGE